MATSGSINSGGYQGRCLQFSWNTQSIDASTNTRTISYSITAIGGTSSWYYHHNNTISINGTNVYTGPNDLKVYNNDILKSDTFTINQSDTLTLRVEMHGGVYYYNDNISTDYSWSLDEIPRYLNSINLYDNGSTLDSISGRWTCDPARDWTQYSLNGGGWTDAGDFVASDNKSGYFNVGGLAPNTTYSLKIRLRRADSGLWSESGTINIRTKNIAYLTSTVDFNDEQSPTIGYNNEFGDGVGTLQACISLTGATDDIVYRDVPKTGSSYTFNLTTAERNVLRNATTTSTNRSVIFFLRTTYNGQTYYSTSTKTLSIVNATPTFSGVSNYSNILTYDLTHNTQIFIKGYNKLEVSISTSKKAEAQKGATMIKYILQSLSQRTEASYSSSSTVKMYLENITSPHFEVYAVDSRGNSKTVSYYISDMKNYYQPVISAASVERTNGVSSNVTLQISGTFWNNSFGYQTNSLTEFSYKYKKTYESNYGNAISITPTISSNNFSFNGLIQGDEGANGFSVSSSYNIQITATDKIKTVTTNIILGLGAPLMAVGRSGVSFGSPYDEIEGGEIQIKGKKIDKYRYAKATITSNQNISSNTKVAISSLAEDTTGGLITVNSNNLVIGAGINTIEVSGLIFCDTVNGSTGNYVWHKIYKQTGNNDTFLIGNICPATTHFISGVLPPTPVSVTQGDKIYMIADNTSSTGFLRAGKENTFLMVRIIN